MSSIFSPLFTKFQNHFWQSRHRPPRAAKPRGGLAGTGAVRGASVMVAPSWASPHPGEGRVCRIGDGWSSGCQGNERTQEKQDCSFWREYAIMRRICGRCLVSNPSAPRCGVPESHEPVREHGDLCLWGIAVSLDPRRGRNRCIG